MANGITRYNESGNPICEICGKPFSRVITHVRQKHQLSEREYKLKFGFDLKKGICSLNSSLLSREKTLANYDKCVAKNLLHFGEKSRFVEGSAGRTKDMVSEQTRIRLKDRLKEPQMLEVLKKSGSVLGKSGLGNKVRWGK